MKVRNILRQVSYYMKRCFHPVSCYLTTFIYQRDIFTEFLKYFGARDVHVGSCWIFFFCVISVSTGSLFFLSRCLINFCLWPHLAANRSSCYTPGVTCSYQQVGYVLHSFCFPYFCLFLVFVLNLVHFTLCINVI